MAKIALLKKVHLRGTWESVEERAISVDCRPGVPVPDRDDMGNLDGFRSSLAAVSSALGESSKFAVEQTESWGDCDDCGSYCDEVWTVYRNGAEIISFSSDGHLGYGDNLHEADDLIVKTLTALGHEVEVARTGTLVLELQGDCCYPSFRADDDAQIVKLNTDLSLELQVGRHDKPCSDYLDQLLWQLPEVTKVTVASDIEKEFHAALQDVEECQGKSAHRVAEIRSKLIIDGSMDQAMRVPAELLAAYFVEGDEAKEAVQRECPMSTYWDLCEAALKRGIGIPEDRLPFSMRPSPV